jgi:DNA-binding transcriptional LysR family regulator
MPRLARTTLESRRFTRAAGTLSRSQPAVSAHIRTLERYYGGPLFRTRHRRVFPDGGGRRTIRVHQAGVQPPGRSESGVDATRRGQLGLLRLGASTTVGVYLLPQLLQRYTREHMRVEVDIAIGSSADIIARVLAEDVPFGIVEAPITHRILDVEPIGQDDMVLIAPNDHPLARGGTVAAQQLAHLPILRRETGSATQALVDAALEHSGINPPRAGC